MSDEIVSLFALMDLHLSKTSLNETSSENNTNNLSRSGSHALLPAPPGSRLAIPKFITGNSSTTDFLAEKISMTLKARQKRSEEEEQRRLEEDIRKLKIEEEFDTSCIKQETETEQLKICNEQEYLIDLTSSIIKQPKLGQVPPKNNQTKQQSWYYSDEDNEPIKSASLSTTHFGQYKIKVGEFTLAEDNSSLDKTVPETYSTEDDILFTPKIELENEFEMIPQKERKLKKKVKDIPWVEEELRKMKIRHEQEYPPLQLLNDMMPQPKPVLTKPKPSVKSKGSTRLLFDKETCRYKEWDPTLPITTGIPYNFERTMKRGKCSPFGKVLCARVRPAKVCFPYPREKLNSNIVRFDFKTKSPADLYRENQTYYKKEPEIKLPTRFLLDLMECI